MGEAIADSPVRKARSESPGPGRHGPGEASGGSGPEQPRRVWRLTGFSGLRGPRRSPPGAHAAAVRRPQRPRGGTTDPPPPPPGGSGWGFARPASRVREPNGPGSPARREDVRTEKGPEAQRDEPGRGRRGGPRVRGLRVKSPRQGPSRSRRPSGGSSACSCLDEGQPFPNTIALWNVGALPSPGLPGCRTRRGHRLPADRRSAPGSLCRPGKEHVSSSPASKVPPLAVPASDLPTPGFPKPSLRVLRGS